MVNTRKKSYSRKFSLCLYFVCSARIFQFSSTKIVGIPISEHRIFLQLLPKGKKEKQLNIHIFLNLHQKITEKQGTHGFIQIRSLSTLLFLST